MSEEEINEDGFSDIRIVLSFINPHDTNSVQPTPAELDEAAYLGGLRSLLISREKSKQTPLNDCKQTL